MKRTSIAITALALLLGACVVGDDEELDPEVENLSLSFSTKKQLQYLVTAHPDDELAAWSLIEKSTDNYPVFIVLTQGEHTGYCEASGINHWQPELGEARPATTLPYVGRGTKQCKDARIASWHRFLDGMAERDNTLSKAPRFRGTFSATAGSFRVWADSKSARVVFDLGDGNLSSAEVTAAIQAVRSQRSQLFPLTKEYGVIAGSYSNIDRTNGCDHYDHSDHRSVHVAIYSTDQGTPGPQWGRTCINDPDVRANGRIEEVDSDTYAHAMGVDAPSWDPNRYPNARRLGAFQVHYGWLRSAYWEGTGRSGTTQFDKRQAFWRRF